MKLLICGSRCIDSIDYVHYCIDVIMQEYEGLITMIIEGGADGVDSLAGLYAKSHYIPLKTVYPNYKEHGDRAPLIRNKEMVDLCDKGIAIWDGYSTGTAHTINLLKKQKKLIRVFQ